MTVTATTEKTLTPRRLADLARSVRDAQFFPQPGRMVYVRAEAGW